MKRRPLLPWYVWLAFDVDALLVRLTGPRNVDAALSRLRAQVRRRS